MAKQSDEQNIRSKARRRLIGAIALALAVVVILPMVLDSEPKTTGQDIELRIPAVDNEGEFVPGVALSEVVEATSMTESAVVASSEPVAVTEILPAKSPDVVSLAAASAPKGIVDAKPEVKAQAVSARRADTRPVEIKQIEAKQVERSAVSYTVQIGAFSNAATAAQEADKLKGWGYRAYTEVVSGTTRVRVGSYQERDKAETVVRLLEKRGQHAVIKVVDGPGK